MKHVVMFSGGIGSWACAKRVAEKHGTKNLFLVFTDVKGNSTDPHVGEDEDTYRFIKDAAANVGGTLIYINEGRDIWEVFKDKRFLGNSRLANCSHELKQKPARDWLDNNCDPAETVVYLGIDWTETHRLAAIIKNYLPFIAEAPLTEPPYLDKQRLIEWAKNEGLKTPRLYDMGFAHNNCGGGCVRAGQAQFTKLYKEMPERFAVWAEKEQGMRDYLDKDVSILKETKNGMSRPLTLLSLQQRIDQTPEQIDMFDIGGCGCFTDSEITEKGTDAT